MLQTALKSVHDKRMGVLHVDLVRCVSANHMHDCESASWVFFEPAIELQCSPF